MSSEQVAAPGIAVTVASTTFAFLNPTDAGLATKVAETLFATGAVRLVTVYDDGPRQDAFLSTPNPDSVCPFTPAYNLVRLLIAYSILEVLLCVIFLFVGIYGFDFSPYKPVCTYYECGGERYDDRLTTYPWTPSFAKFAYTTLMGRSLVVLAMSSTIGRYPELCVFYGVANALFSAVFLIGAMLFAWVDMKGRPYKGSYYQVPLTIIGIFNLCTPCLLLGLNAQLPAFRVKTSVTVVGNDGIIVCFVTDLSTRCPDQVSRAI